MLHIFELELENLTENKQNSYDRLQNDRVQPIDRNKRNLIVIDLKEYIKKANACSDKIARVKQMSSNVDSWLEAINQCLLQLTIMDEMKYTAAAMRELNRETKDVDASIKSMEDVMESITYAEETIRTNLYWNSTPDDSAIEAELDELLSDGFKTDKQRGAVQSRPLSEGENGKQLQQIVGLEFELPDVPDKKDPKLRGPKNTDNLQC